MSEAEAFLELLRRDGVVRAPEARLTPLSGGVSCEIYLVEDGAERFVVKRALAKLKVAADWFADVNRNRHEWEYIKYVARFLPESVPALRHCSAADNYFVMEHLNGSYLNWKKLLLGGEASVAHASQAGDLLGQIHRHSAGDEEARRVFDTTPNFFQLRIEPYLLATGAKHPALRPLIEAEAARLADTRECLVHGDFSPKNILVSPARMVLLDCEVAWYGDPAFDLAFLLNHFFLKSLLHAPRATETHGQDARATTTLFHAPRAAGWRAMIEGFWNAYQAVRPTPAMGPRVGRLLPMLMLARVDGKSPVEYLDSARQEFVREFLRAQLPQKDDSLHDLTDAWFERLKYLNL